MVTRILVSLLWPSVYILSSRYPLCLFGRLNRFFFIEFYSTGTTRYRGGQRSPWCDQRTSLAHGSVRMSHVVHLYSSSKFDINTSRKRIHNTLKQSIMGLYL